jgi:hypothetical protein
MMTVTEARLLAMASLGHPRLGWGGLRRRSPGRRGPGRR